MEPNWASQLEFRGVYNTVRGWGGLGPLSLSHLLDFFQVLRKIRVCTTPPQPQLVQIDKWTSSKEEDGTAPEKGCGVRRTGAEVAVSKGGMLLSHPLSQITSSSVQEKSKGKVGGLPGSPVTKRHTPKAGAQVWILVRELDPKCCRLGVHSLQLKKKNRKRGDSNWAFLFSRKNWVLIT